MGRFLLYLSSHWVRYRIALGDKKLQKQNRSYLDEIATLKAQRADLIAELEAEKVKSEIQRIEVDCLNELVECSRKRVEATIRSFNVAGEEPNVS